ncbi:MAG: hypothetical protein LLG00_11585 [Planctomycetaceae bacterium]|nr:hypothetical protein [Planctomycetaceae bacterium]
MRGLLAACVALLVVLALTCSANTAMAAHAKASATASVCEGDRCATAAATAVASQACCDEEKCRRCGPLCKLKKAAKGVGKGVGKIAGVERRRARRCG